MKKTILLTTLLLTVFSQLYSQQFTNYTFINTSTTLREHSVRCMAIDAQGNKWFGTYNGIYKFDGTTWSFLNTNNGLVSNFVLDIVTDKQGIMWFGTSYGVSRFDGTTWTSYTTADGLINNNVKRIVIDAKGNKWFVSWGNGVSRFDGTTWTNYTTANGLADNYVNSIATDAQGNTWFGTSNGVSKFNGTTWTKYTTTNGLANNLVLSIAIDADGNKWFGTADRGVSKFDGTSWTTYTTANGLVANTASTIAIDANGNKWFGTSWGISRFDGTNWTTYTTDNGLGNNQINSITFDAQGNSWFTTSEGISKFDGTSWTRYSANGLADDPVISVAIDAQGDKWFGTALGVSKFDGTTWTTYTTVDGLAGKRINSIAIDAQGNKWVGTNNGLSKFDGNTWTTYNTISGLANNYVSSITIDAQGNKWIGTNGGVSKFDGTNWTTYTTANGLITNTVRNIAIDAQGNKWFGTYNGLSKFDGNTWTSYTTSNGLVNNYVNSIATDAQGNTWVGTIDGVSKFDGASWTTYTTTNGLANNYVKSIAIDAQGNKWIGTWGGGLSRFDGTKWITYTEDNRLLNNYIHSIAIDALGNKWIGTNGGVSMLNDTNANIKVSATVATTAGNLMTDASNYLSTVTHLTVTGIIDARDFKTMRDNMPLLKFLDISAVTIAAYNGSLGTNEFIDNYYANKLPDGAFVSIGDKISTATNIILPNSILSLPRGIDRIFPYDLTNLTIGNKITYIDEMTFSYLNNLCDLTLGDGMIDIDLYSINSLGSLNAINITPGNPNYSSIDGILFSKDKSSLILYPQAKSGAYNIPSTTTSVTNQAFYSCKALTSISIPTSVTAIGSMAFTGCDNLTNIYSYATTPIELGTTSNVFSFNKANCKLYVPIGSKEKYMAANQWKDFTIIEGLPAIVTTQTVSNIGAIATTGNGNITNIGSYNLTQYGVVWSTTSCPTITLSTKTEQGTVSSTGAFISELTDLTSNTKYYVRAYATNDAGTSYGEEVTFTTIANSAPTDISLSASAINENVAANSPVGTLSSTDPDVGNTLTYNLVTGTGDTDNASFTIEGSNLKITNSPDFETKSSYTVRVRTADQGNLYFEKTFTITINNVNEAPTDITLSASAISENVAANSAVGTLSSTDPDVANTFTYTLVAGTGSTDNAAFNISGSSLRITASPDFETKSSYSVRVRTTDQGGLYFEKSFTITVNDLNEAPTTTTKSASSISSTAATLNGTVNPNNATSVVTFDYGTSTSYGSSATATQSPVTGTSATSVSSALTGLTPNTTYHFRIKAVNTVGTTYGADSIFTTSAIAPTITGISPTSGATTGGTSVIITGTNFTGATAVKFGSTNASSYTVNSATQITAVSPAGAAGAVDVTVVTTGGTNAISSADQFTYVAAPIVTTNTAGSIATTSALLKGTVNANNASTAVAFEYGLTTSYGTTITATQSPVTGNTATAVSCLVSGLTPNTTYHFRVNGVNAGGTTNGTDLTFTTALGTALVENENHQLILYPNPITDVFRIIGLHGVSSISLTDLSGRTMLQQQISDNESVSVKTIPAGVYVLKIKNNEGNTECKVIKK